MRKSSQCNFSHLHSVLQGYSIDQGTRYEALFTVFREYFETPSPCIYKIHISFVFKAQLPVTSAITVSMYISQITGEHGGRVSVDWRGFLTFKYIHPFMQLHGGKNLLFFFQQALKQMKR